jgi:hypothetical protein
MRHLVSHEKGLVFIAPGNFLTKYMLFSVSYPVWIMVLGVNASRLLIMTAGQYSLRKIGDVEYQVPLLNRLVCAAIVSTLRPATIGEK